MNVLVLREYEFRNQQVRQNRFIEIVAKLQTGVCLLYTSRCV